MGRVPDIQAQTPEKLLVQTFALQQKQGVLGEDSGVPPNDKEYLGNSTDQERGIKE